MAKNRQRRPVKPIRDRDRGHARIFHPRTIYGVAAGIAVGTMGYILAGGAGFVVGFALGAIASWKAIDVARAVLEKLFFGSGSSTPYKHQHSQALALIVQGKYEAALAELERDIGDDPASITPYLHAARLCRDRMQRPEEAVAWFKRARSQAQLSPGEEAMITRELVELYKGRLKQPGRAIPELARAAELSKGTPEGEWARAELEALRALVADAERLNS